MHSRAALTTLSFPWESLETVTALEVAALRDARRWMARGLRLDAFGAAFQDLIGATVRVLVSHAGNAGTRARHPSLDGALGVVLAFGDVDAPASTALLEVEAALAAAVVARALKRPPLVAVNLATPPSSAVAGAFAALVVAAARRAHVEAAPLRVVSTGAASPVQAGFALGAAGPGELVTLSLTVLVGDEAYAARVSMSPDGALTSPAPDWTLRKLSSLGATPLSIPIVACATLADVGDIATLREGDAWIPGPWPLELATDAGDATASLRGPVVLAAPAASMGVRARLVEGGRLVLSGELDAVCAAEADMTESDRENALLEAVGDVPVVVRVEIGEARMAARDWAALGRGDVITIGKRLGDQVVLRVGGVPVARGELINVDGEVGVRIAERLGGDATRS